jgi:cellulose biosynthesis protein BcsQ
LGLRSGIASVGGNGSSRSISMKSIAFFNNKGGVGKTTLSCNIAAHLATRLRKRVLVVDCDPQCNATQLVLSEVRCQEIYRDGGAAQGSTLLTVMGPIRDGDAFIAPDTTPELSSRNRFGVDLLPGHPAMSVVEDLLSSAWSDLRGAQTGGFRITNWFPQLMAQFRTRYDVVVVDLGPSLGPLTRSVLLGSDFFVTPMGCDIFSIVGIRNIGEWLGRWIGDYERFLEHFRRDGADAIIRYGIQERLSVKHGFVGYTVLQYITKSREGERRATAAFEEILGQIPGVVRDSLGTFFKNGLTLEQSHLGDIPNLFSLVPLAQSAHAPIISLRSQDGLAGGQYKQQEVYAKFIETVGDRLATNIGLDA